MTLLVAAGALYFSIDSGYLRYAAAAFGVLAAAGLPAGTSSPCATRPGCSGNAASPWRKCSRNRRLRPTWNRPWSWKT